jgi:hypothetical protein
LKDREFPESTNSTERKRGRKMFTVRWFWVDGSFDEFQVETKKHAEMMALQLYKNPDIVSVEISDR